MDGSASAASYLDSNLVLSKAASSAIDRSQMRVNFTAYATASLAVGLSALIGWFVQDWLVEGLPVVAFLPAIVVAAALGGSRAGLFAAALSVAIARPLFLNSPSLQAFGPRIAGSLLFLLLASLAIVTAVALLKIAIERVAVEAQKERSLIESAPNGIIVVGRAGKMLAANSSAERLFGYRREELLGRSVEMLVPKRASVTHKVVREAFQRSPETRPMGAGRDLRARRKDGDEFPVEIGLNPLEWSNEPAVLATITDITERKQHEERQRILARELEHGVGNFFALILAIIRRTLTTGRSISEAEQILTGRVQSLAKVHAVASEAMFQKVSMDKLLETDIAGFRDQIEAKGLDVSLSAKAAQAFALVINELVTNAVKHGALSTPSGRVLIDKRVEDIEGEKFITFEWKERGGPPVTAASRKGFGSFIIEEWPKQFDGRTTITYPPSGLSYQLHLPLASVTDNAGVDSA
ncbi:Signal transduction histidine kinase [Methylocystis sp. SC2]|nr:Signal transduction histidine kinase [Methylocystis sp. SC2]